ncbi:hypothetical protein Nos7524_5682 (plasmid) [Nostoc sp. PCC 7524]|uniref:ATP-binding protein n=2 Tax=Nostocaceae TaxID=1162 RepID=UPI00000B5E2F|nr:ATP-binding protein [Nostoc sp. PCC 7524]AAM76168.1 Orf3 [Nostoc sp. PCC 7524]AFY51369.1 hypothetical protein Nos7524_5682 [Nostoc sp. PCC 7524]
MANDWIEMHLPSRQQLGRFLLWGLGRLTFSASIFLFDATSYALQTALTVVKWCRQSVYNLVKVYDQLPYAGTYGAAIIDTTAVTLAVEPEGIITDLMQALSGKHCLIVGDTGTGKSTIAQWLAYQVGGEVTVYDADAAPDEWTGLNVIGRRGDFEAIQSGMAADLEELQRRIELRGESGDKALAGKESVLIAEELPLLRDEVEIATEWLIKHARRGRKPKRFVIGLTQDDNVKTLGIEGEGGVRKCFRMLRLGKFAVSHAKSLKDLALVEWLKSGKYRCMVDDMPCQLPDVSSYKMVMPRLQSVTSFQPLQTAQPTSEQALQPVSSLPEPRDETLAKVVKACLEAGFSESKVIKEILGYQGGRYQEGKSLLEKLKDL